MKVCLVGSSGGHLTHGSTINASIKNATGKYYKIVDSDDWVDSKELEKLVIWLKSNDVDLVLTPYKCVNANKNDKHELVYPYNKSKAIGKITNIDKNEDIIVYMHSTTFGLNSTLITVTHEVGQKNQRGGACCAKAITIGDVCWIGAYVTVLPGVHIAKGCIIGACSVVTKDTEANGLYVGNPARKIKRRLRRSS